MTASVPTLATGQRRRRNAFPLPTSNVAHSCVIVAVDTAGNSGWCIARPDRTVVDSGEVKAMRHAELVAIIKRALLVAEQLKMPRQRVVLVLEKPWRKPHSQRSARSQHCVLQGLGGAAHAWRSAWCEAFGTLHPHRVVTVMPQAWRLRVLGLTGGSGLPKRENDTAAKLRGNGTHAPREVGSDEAAAICIAKWAQHAGEVAAVLPKARAGK